MNMHISAEPVMTTTGLPELNRGIYQGAIVMRLDDQGRPTRLMMNFMNTPEAVAFVEEIYAVTTRTPFAVYESYSFPLA
ncbi:MULTISPECIES: hypothetical protein [unclassified Mesorhizobium]|uniref:hypothetical protein n=1 Tax=unclassified Mesorhizobium TaxID=325217 RepID=UPI001126C33B|nr:MULTISPECIES: hypothetical protein [unclassified Mesorhizobium]MBZ9999628.1 hypothetical protein [Mesorhizobium sp. B264B2A]MCA0008102.1 hypothetical protein [Mesorhizobium sp. B264B1B]MCA0018024.1 hypothetical protein [Mesorhizobium sp. B264B1A]TPJ37859.1 hypothetical protein FJ437_31515 [Mesorhizobium sp. B2-6-6]